MRPHPPGQGDYLAIVAILGAFVIVLWVLFGHILVQAIGGR